MDVRRISIADYDYHLPQCRIATHPVEGRDGCRLLVSSVSGLEHCSFGNLPELLPSRTFLVRNNTRVIHARLPFRKPTGAAIEIFLLEPVSPADYASNFESTASCSWLCLVGNLKKWKEGEVELSVDTSRGDVVLKAKKGAGEQRADGSLPIEFRWDAQVSFAEMVESAGRIPIPPYLNRESEDADNTDYQTIYARVQGSVAAPTAGLHFTDALFKTLEKKGVEIADLTLHVGAGTFKPVKVDEIGGHDMHTETFSVSQAFLRRLINAMEQNRPIVAVGTTSVRTLESLPRLAMSVKGGGKWHVEQWQAYGEDMAERGETIELLKFLLHKLEEEGVEEKTASTAIMIAPGFMWRIVEGMVTNFHQPRSTLLLLVSAFLGGDRWRFIYGEAIREGYRFLSYGDACLFLRNTL